MEVYTQQHSHPAYDETTRNYVPTPRPSSRVKPEAQEYAQRNRKSFEFGFSTSASTPRHNSYAGGRFCSDQGRENLVKSRGSIETVMQQTGNGGGFDSQSESGRSLAIKPEAEGHAEQHRGGRMNLLMSNYGKNETTPRPGPRVKPEASLNYNNNRGSAMNSLLHSARKSTTPRLGPRVKPEAENNASKNRGSMNSIMRQCTPRY